MFTLEVVRESGRCWEQRQRARRVQGLGYEATWYCSSLGPSASPGWRRRPICRRRRSAVPAPKPNCYASFWTWLNSSADDCPISAYGVTLYGTLDVGYGYQQWGAGYNPSVDKSYYGLNKAEHEHIWQGVYNGLSTSVVGVKLKEDLAALGLPGWAVVGVAEAGVNPYSGMLDNGPHSLASNNFYNAAGISTITLNGKEYFVYNTWQSTNLDSAVRASGTTRRAISASATTPSAR